MPGCEKTESANNTDLFTKETSVSIQAIREYLLQVWLQYKSASVVEKTAMLDELERNLGYHRKSANRLMLSPYPPKSLHGFRGGRRRKYSEASHYHLEKLWEHKGYIGPRRVKAALPEWLEYYDHRDCDDRVRDELLRMSVSSIQRFLAKPRAKLKRKLNQGTHRGVRKFISRVPIRDLEHTPSEPGHCEIDCVAHCGGSISGRFVWTLNFTDIFSGWTECEALEVKGGSEVRRALTKIERRLPFKLKALYFDNGSEFLNVDVVDYFATNNRKEKLPVFRGRPYRKNDQCYVEQKNYTHVRQLFGYCRIETRESWQRMNEIYRTEWRRLQNFFLPQEKLIEKFRIGSKVIRKMDRPKTPYQRLQDYESQLELMNEKATYNPIRCRKTLKIKLRSLLRAEGITHKPEWGKIAI